MKKKLFYGWIVVIAIFLILAVGWGITFNSSSIFISPIEKDLGFTRSQMLNAVTIRGIVKTLIAFYSGWIFSKYNIKRVMEISTIVLCISYFSMSFMTSIIQYYILISIQAACIMLCGFVPLSIIINNWFFEKNAIALGFAFMGTGIGGMIFNLVGGRLIPQIGWRKTILIFATIMFVVMVISVFFLIKVSQKDKGLEPYGNKEKNDSKKSRNNELTGIYAKDAIRTFKFWMIGIGIIIMGMNMTGLVTNIAPHLSDIGYSLSTSAKVASLTMICLAFGKLLMGVLFDKYGIRNATLLTCLALIIGVLGMIFAKYRISFVGISVGVGLGCSFCSIALPLYAEKIYGRLDFPKILAYFQTMSNLGGIVAPLIMGAMYKSKNSYNSSLFLLLGCLIFAFFIWLKVLPKNKERSQTADSSFIA